MKSISNGFLFSGVHTCSTVLFENVRVIQPSAKPGIIIRWVGLTIRTANKTLNSSEERKNPGGKKKRSNHLSGVTHFIDCLNVCSIIPVCHLIKYMCDI